MRKKSHRRINASNRDYDCFYIINYLVRKLLIGSGSSSFSSSLLCVTSGVGEDLGGGAERGRQ